MKAPTIHTIAEFAELVFNKRHYADTFPCIFSHGSLQHLHTVFCDKKLAALAATHQVIWLLDRRIYRGVCIGSVCSSPKFRGQGLALEALRLAEDSARNLAADFVFLFSELTEYYERAGYRSAGNEIFVRLAPGAHDPEIFQKNRSTLAMLLEQLSSNSTRNKPSLDLFSSAELLKNPALSMSVWRFSCRHAAPAESHLSYLEFLHALEIPKLHFLILRDEGEIRASAMLGKGADFENILHGLCHLEIFDALVLLQAALKRLPDGFTLMVPPGQEQIFSRFISETCALFFVKILREDLRNEGSLFSLLDRRGLYPRSLQSI